MEAIAGPLRIYFLPFWSPGHMIPLVDIARLFAARGEHVTIISTLSNAKPFTTLIDQDRANYGSHIHIHTIQFPSKEVGLPEGFENSSLATDNNSAAKLCTAAHLVQSQVEAFVKANPPHVMVTDMVFTWSHQLTSRLGIPRFVFNALSIFVSCMTDAIKRHPEALSESDSDSESPFVVPDLPHPITLNVKPVPGFIRMIQAYSDAEHNSVGVILNGFPELEAEYAEHYEKVTGRKVWSIGPASLMLKNNTNTMDKDLVEDEEQHECLNWLNKQEPKSVVYISFGSLSRFNDDQLFEIACGMEASGHKFLWVVRRKEDENDKKEEDKKKWLPPGFEERMKEENKGMIIRGWAPQVQILNNAAIGGFLTQCGWNAMAETISVGVPMITMPGFGDQYFNQKLITQVRGFGVEVGGQEWRFSPYDDRKKVVGRERIEEAVRRLMDGGEEAVHVRRRAKELQVKAWNAVKDGGSSHRNLTALIQHIKELVFINENMSEKLDQP